MLLAYCMMYILKNEEGVKSEQNKSHEMSDVQITTCGWFLVPCIAIIENYPC